MINSISLYNGSLTVIIWGIAHLFPTNSVIRGFGDISADNKKILKMEWINEGITLIFIGVLVLFVKILGGHDNGISRIVYLASGFFLFLMATISLFTGFRVNFLPYKLCPFIFSISGVLIIVGSFL